MNGVKSLARRVGEAVKASGGAWHGRHMAAAARAIMDRVPLVDLVLEIRDARIPFSSAYHFPVLDKNLRKHLVVLNKVDLADSQQTERWVKHLKKENIACLEVNSHNKDKVNELLNVVRTRIRELKVGEHDYTATVMLVGIPNVGKSAIANRMHQIGRIGAEEKGKLKHAVVSPRPGETKDISGYKIASHPNIYVLDTPGILHTEVVDEDVGSKLALTGAIEDSFVGNWELARYFLSILNTSKCIRHWEITEPASDESLSMEHKEAAMFQSSSPEKGKRQYATDHTQDFVVRHVRKTLHRTLSAFEGNLKDEFNMERLIEDQFRALRKAFNLKVESDEEGLNVAAKKLLNLFRIGRLGRYTFDHVQATLEEDIT